ncbi:MAG TPA: hypothetical protein V6C69_18285 [Trichormus sp.]|jgi:hypothetical protein
MQAINVLLFDVDGVLVEPRAYRLCIDRTLEVLLPQIGIATPSDFLPSYDDVSYFEAQGIHDCWDITNIIYAQIVAATGDRPNRATDLVIPAYQPFVDRIRRANAELHPPSVAASLLAVRTDAPNDFAEQKKFTELVDCLHGSRSVYKSHVTRLFQNILLGSSIFESTYNLPSQYDGKPLLQAEDRVLLGTATVEKLKDLHARAPEHWKMAIYTARPSLKPEFAGGSSAGYSPEAEIARQSAGLNKFPLIGMGTMEFLAERTNDLAQNLVKPKTTQAFAALLSALNGSVNMNLLEQALAMGVRDALPESTALAQWKDTPLNIYVFEDTVSGIIPMDIVAKRLREHGYSINLTSLGIAKQKDKREALLKFCPAVYDDVNDAFDFVMSKTPQAAIEEAK